MPFDRARHFLGSCGLALLLAVTGGAPAMAASLTLPAIAEPASPEHHVGKVLIAELQSMPEMNEQYEAKFTVLIENVEHHIEEEEKEMLPDAKKTLGDEIDALGDRMDARKSELMAATR